MMKPTKQLKHAAKLGISGRQLKLRSWGVITLHHYERISPRDPEWHRGKNGRGRKEVKLSCFFDKRVKPRNLARLNKLREKENNEDEHSVRKEEQVIRREPRGLVIR